MTTSRRHRLAAATLAGVLGATPVALAQDTPTAAEARVHFDRAVALFESGDAPGALAEFQRAFDLTGRASVLYNIGATYQALHDYPRAIDALRRYLAAAPGRTTPQRDLAERALAQMEPLVARLRVVRSPPDATVLLDGRALDGERATVGPGTHLLAASAPGREARTIEVTVVSGDDREVSVSLPLVRPVVVGAVITPPPPPVEPVIAPPDRRLFWSLVVTGGALAVGATITGFVALAAQRDYAAHRVGDPEAPGLASRGRALAVTADLLGVGALAAGTTAFVIGLRASPRGPSRGTRVSVAPTLGGAAVTVFGTF